jgi:hypothetical protein
VPPAPGPERLWVERVTGPGGAIAPIQAPNSRALGMFPSGAEASIALAQPPLRPPTDSLAGLGALFPPAREMAPPLGRSAGGPGAFQQGPARLGVARLGEAALTPPLPTGLC